MCAIIRYIYAMSVGMDIRVSPLKIAAMNTRFARSIKFQMILMGNVCQMDMAKKLINNFTIPFIDGSPYIRVFQEVTFFHHH